MRSRRNEPTALRYAADLGRGAALLTAFWLVGAGLTRLLPWVPLTGSLWGMVLLFAALASGGLPEAWVRRAAAAFIRVLGLLFVPVGVGIVAYGELVAQQALALVVALGVGSLATLLASAVAVAGFGARHAPDAREEP